MPTHEAAPAIPGDASIPDGARVWRRVPAALYVVEQGRPQSNAFTDSSDGSPMSATLVVEGAEVESYLRATAAKEGTGVVELSVSYLRGLGLQVVRSADSTGRDPSHVSVIGEKTKSVQRALAKGATWILRPTAPRGG
jgi:hypothetical protein